MGGYLSRHNVAKVLKRRVLNMKQKPSLLAAGWVYKAAYVAICAGGLLPRRFTFSFTCKGSLLSVALSLRLPWPSVRWNHASLQLGLSS